MEPDETRAEASRRLAGKMSVSPSTLYGWVKKATPAPAGRSVLAGFHEDLVAQIAALKKENRELARANDILKAASTWFSCSRSRARNCGLALMAWMTVIAISGHGVIGSGRHKSWNVRPSLDLLSQLAARMTA